MISCDGLSESICILDIDIFRAEISKVCPKKKDRPDRPPSQKQVTTVNEGLSNGSPVKSPHFGMTPEDSPGDVRVGTYLVGGWPTPLKNMKISWDDDIPNIWMFQTTNQNISVNLKLRANDLPCCSRSWLGMIPLYIHHDSRVRSRREVTLIHPKIQVYVSWSMKWRSIIELYIHHTYIHTHTYIYIYIIHIYIYHTYHRYFSGTSHISMMMQPSLRPASLGIVKPKTQVFHRGICRGHQVKTWRLAEHLSRWLPKKTP